MQTVELHLENCYGIKKFKHAFNFTESKTHLVYAPNGVMKSSFAQTLEDITLGKESKDRIFADRINHRSIKVDDRDILAEEIFVIQRMKTVEFKEASTILANENLKATYDTINTKLNEAKIDFIKALQPYFGVKENLVEKEIANAFRANLFTVFEEIESSVNSISEPFYANISFNEIFNEKVIKFLESKDFKSKISEYINVYDKLVNENDVLFMKGTFNHYNADVVTKSLKENNFFNAKHKVKIKDKEINDIQELESLINTEKEKVLNNPELTSKFNEIDKSLNSNIELRKFRLYVEQNQEIIKEFADLNIFKKKLIVHYLATNKDAFNVLLKLYKETNEQRKQIIEKAKEEQEDWKNVLEIFKRRFTIPFKVKIKNQENVILNNEPVSLIFEYTDGDGPSNTKELGGSELQESLSTGEQRVFYLLNIIFQIETRKRLHRSQLVVVDDIADSFDYKNKYAIIEYLKDVLDNAHFYMIILTHNFDFYKTIKSRLGAKINYQGNWSAIKRTNEVKLIKGEREDAFLSLRTKFDTCDFTFLACIPFVRNLIEFSVGTDNDNYYKLTSLLHLKPQNTERSISRTQDLTKGEVFSIFNSVFGLSKTPQSPSDKVYDLIFLRCSEIMSNSVEEPMDLKNKICLSLAIRLKAEEFMLSRITDANFHSNIMKKQTGKIIGQYKKEFSSSVHEIGVLERVNLMTAENIHVNSFMYEPLMDLADNHLRHLYNDVCNLS